MKKKSVALAAILSVCATAFAGESWGSSMLPDAPEVSFGAGMSGSGDTFARRAIAAPPSTPLTDEQDQGVALGGLYGQDPNALQPQARDRQQVAGAGAVPGPEEACALMATNLGALLMLARRRRLRD